MDFLLLRLKDIRVDTAHTLTTKKISIAIVVDNFFKRERVESEDRQISLFHLRRVHSKI